MGQMRKRNVRLPPAVTGARWETLPQSLQAVVWTMSYKPLLYTSILLLILALCFVITAVALPGAPWWVLLGVAALVLAGALLMAITVQWARFERSAYASPDARLAVISTPRGWYRGGSRGPPRCNPRRSPAPPPRPRHVDDSRRRPAHHRLCTHEGRTSRADLHALRSRHEGRRPPRKAHPPRARPSFVGWPLELTASSLADAAYRPCGVQPAAGRRVGARLVNDPLPYLSLRCGPVRRRCSGGDGRHRGVECERERCRCLRPSTAPQRSHCRSRRRQGGGR